MGFFSSTSKKTAILLSYVTLVLNTATSIILTPLLLRYLGVDEYGLYQMVYSIGHYILILDLGISSVMVRYIAEYRAKGDKEGEENFSAIIGRITLFLAGIIVIVGLIVNGQLENIFKNLSTSDYEKSHRMFILMIIQFAIVILEHFFQGIAGAYERFNFLRSIGLGKVLLVFFLTIFFVKSGMGAVGIVVANLAVSVLLFFALSVYVFRELNFRIRFHRWDFVIIRPALGLMLAMLLQSLVGSVNYVADKTILGIMCTPKDVSIYAVATTIITLFNTVPTVISGLFQPQVTRMIVKGTTPASLTDLVIRVGRWQFMLCVSILMGLILFGKDFLTLWVGKRLSLEQITFSWIIVLIVLPFNMVPLIQTVCISILNGYDKRLDRSLILVGVSVVNVIVSVFCVRRYGPIGAPIGSAISYFLGYIVIMNWYYGRVIHLEVRRMFKEIFNKTMPCAMMTMLLCLPLWYWHSITWFSFIVKVSSFVVIFLVLMLLYGFNKEEKSIVHQALSHCYGRRKRK